ncbi:MAG: histidine kinase [Microbacteriaceae bacterium]
MRTPERPWRRRGASRWEVLPRALESGVLVILLLAVGTEIATAAFDGATVAQYLPVVLIVAGVAASYRVPYLGLGIVAAAPVLAALVGREPATGIWSMACFAVFLFTLRGLSALLIGAIVAVVNFAAVAGEVGTIDVNVDASASIAAFATVVCAAIGSAVHGNHRYRQEAERRVTDAEAGRVAAVERGIAQERLRIARDLHDSIGHQIAVVNMRLGAAEVHLPPDADETRADLAAARDGVQAVLRETQQILAVLRLGDAEHGLEPTPGLTVIENLVASCREAGMVIEASLEDVTGELSAQASMAAYRIVQEALTNAQKHGEGTVSVTVGPDEHGGVLIEVVNLRRTRGAAAPGGGNGLVGMRERAESVGGTLSTRADERLFWVTAAIPAER